MKMNKMFAGLIAFVAGVALSAGSAFATNGYVGGDFARDETGSPITRPEIRKRPLSVSRTCHRKRRATMALHQDVMDLTAYLGGAAATQAMVDNLNAADITLTADVVVDEPILVTDLNAVAADEAALEKAQGKCDLHGTPLHHGECLRLHGHDDGERDPVPGGASVRRMWFSRGL